ncbi:MAG: hypothetical protein ACU84Q_01685 [Gammaproteobacteria bacterium]
MPTHIKIIVSIVTLIVGAVFFYLENSLGQAHVAKVGAFLSVFMVVAMWIFPEAGDRAKKN